MNVKTTKTTTENATISFSSTIKDENGTDMAKMSASVNTSTPFGSCNCVVVNRKLFDEHSEDIRKEYIKFVEQVSTSYIEPTTKTEDVDDEEIEDSPATDIPSEDEEE